MDVSERFVAFTSSDTGAAAVAGNAWVTLDFGSTADMAVPEASRRKKLVLHRVHTLRKTDGGGVANRIALIADVTGSLSTAWATKYESASTAVATRLNETRTGDPLYTSTEGKLFFTPGGDALDTYDYEVWFRVVL